MSLRPNGDLLIFLIGREEPIVRIQDQFDDGAGKVVTLTVEPVGGGSPVYTPIGDPNDVGFYVPHSPPTWIEAPHDAFGAAESNASPLIVDLDADGIELTAFDAETTTTFFDIDGDGFAEQTAWVSSDDGLLVRDLNANDKIDDVTELFGSPTIDGFAKLAVLDNNGDLIINQYDDAWDDLRIWQDSNGDAVTQDGELLTLSSLNIESIDLAGITASSTTISGNPISHTGSFEYNDGSTGSIVDAWFVKDDVNTYYTGDYTLDVRSLFLPTLRGFGELPDLHIAMSDDEGLLDLVQQFSVDWGNSRFATLLDGSVENILYRWAGVDTVSSDSRGPNIDARVLGVLERLFGEDYVQVGDRHDPSAAAAKTLMDAWDDVLGTLKAQLVVQLSEGDIFDGGATYDLYAGEVDGTFALSETGLDALASYASAAGVDTEAFWREVAGFIDHTKGLTNVTATEEGYLDTALYDSGSSYDWQDVLDSMVDTGWVMNDAGTAAGDTLYGSTGPDQLGGSAGYDIIYGDDGDDSLSLGTDGGQLYGESGNDILNGGTGADILSGGGGGDIVQGDDGADTYIFTGGNDWYSEYGGSGADVIQLPSGIDAGDLVYYRANDDSLFMDVGSLGDIEIYRWFYATLFQIETIQFSDSSTLSLSEVTTFDFYGTEGPDTLVGEDTIDETIYGYGGDDVLRGQGGNDILDGGAGNDELWGVSGDDTFIASPGFDTIKETGGTDELVIPAGYSLEDLTFLKSGYDLVVQIADLGQVLLEKQVYPNNNYHLENIFFTDTQTSVALSSISVEQRGGNGNDSLSGITTGVSQNDILNGMGGNDTLQGKDGDDTYVFSTGSDIIYEKSGADTILFWEGWSPSEIDIYRQQSVGTGWDDLVVADQDGNKTTVESFFDYPSGNGEIETIEFHDSTTWDLTNMTFETWGTSGADTITVSSTQDQIAYGFGGDDVVNVGTGNDRLYGGDGNDTLNGSSGNDILYGEDGNDTLIGNAGDDTFVFSAGLDTVNDTGDNDTLWLAGGVTINDISIADLSSYDATITINAGVDEVVVEDLRYSQASRHIETLTFDDGFTADLPSYNSWLNGSSGNDLIAGSANDNVLIGFDGNDQIDSGAGADHAHGGAGADIIHGDDGDDLLHGGVGDDILYGDDGLDTLFGGSGTDTFVFEAASAFNNVDVVKDFSTADGDVLDISDILSASYDPMTDAITDFVQITDNGTDSTLSIDTDGGADNFVAVASILGVTGLTDEQALVTSGNLLAA